MPVPKPEFNESEREYISRCEKFMHEENKSNQRMKSDQTNRLARFVIRLGAENRFKFP